MQNLLRGVYKIKVDLLIAMDKLSVKEYEDPFKGSK